MGIDNHIRFQWYNVNKMGNEKLKQKVIKFNHLIAKRWGIQNTWQSIFRKYPTVRPLQPWGVSYTVAFIYTMHITTTHKTKEEPQDEHEQWHRSLSYRSSQIENFQPVKYYDQFLNKLQLLHVQIILNSAYTSKKLMVMQLPAINKPLLDF